MNIEISTSPPLKFFTPALVLGCFEDFNNSLFSVCDKALDGCLSRLYLTGEFKGKPNTTCLIHTQGKLPAERILLVGLGAQKGFNSVRLRTAAGSAIQALRSARVVSFATALHQSLSDGDAIEAVCEGTLLGSYRFEQYKTKNTDDRFSFAEMTLLLAKGTKGAEARATSDRSRQLYGGVALARDLVSHPGNIATTAYLADTARKLATRHNMTCRVLEMSELEQLGMNALVAVGKGSVEPPRLIVLEYNGAGDRSRPVALVGKGITFDSGGISLKPGAGMEEMKTDMAGAAAVLGTLEAAASLGLKVNITGVIPTAENMPDGNAYKPGDILTSLSGQTIEITNTDAEGRLILCDALHYTRSTCKPAVMIDLATLTGACVVALGHEASGMMGNDRKLIDSLKRAGERCGERLWELPLWDEYGDTMKSDIADLKNAGSRDGGSITAGWFLKQFVGSTRWVHLDIAGTAWSDKVRPCTPKGASGVGVRLLIEYLRNM